jgi:hypothetical protein
MKNAAVVPVSGGFWDIIFDAGELARSRVLYREDHQSTWYRMHAQ